MRIIIFVLFSVLAGAAQLTLAAKPTKAQSDELRELKTLLEKQRQYLNVLEKRIEQLSEQETKKKSVVTTPKTKPVDAQAESVSKKPEKIEPVGKKPPESESKKPTKAEVESISSISRDARGILTPKGNLVLEPSLKYAHSSTNRVFLEGFGPLVVPSFFLGLIDIREVDRDIFIGSITARYGITSRMAFEIKVPYVYREDRIRSRPLLTNLFGDDVFEADGSGLGDVEFALDYQLNDGLRGWPFFTGSFRVRSRTGTDPFEVDTVDILVRDSDGNVVQDEDGNALIERFPTELPTGTGFWGFQPSLTLIYPTDPAVLFGTLSYNWNKERNVGGDIGKLDPGDTLGISGGMGFGINDRTSFSLGFSFQHVSKTEQNGATLKASDLDIGKLLVGYSFRLTRDTNLNLSVGIGATDDAQDFELTLRVPITFDLL